MVVLISLISMNKSTIFEKSGSSSPLIYTSSGSNCRPPNFGVDPTYCADTHRQSQISSSGRIDVASGLTPSGLSHGQSDSLRSAQTQGIESFNILR
jgi:hypothetical protein